jgi:dihydrolipoamide dehydrogenase
VVLATGSKPRELPFAEFDGKRVISSDHALYLEKLPKKAIVLGSGAVGMEFATAWDAFGVEVTIVELEDRLLPLEDADSSKEIARAFRKRGIDDPDRRQDDRGQRLPDVTVHHRDPARVTPRS